MAYGKNSPTIDKEHQTRDQSENVRARSLAFGYARTRKSQISALPKLFLMFSQNVEDTAKPRRFPDDNETR